MKTKRRSSAVRNPRRPKESHPAKPVRTAAPPSVGPSDPERIPHLVYPPASDGNRSATDTKRQRVSQGLAQAKPDES